MLLIAVFSHLRVFTPDICNPLFSAILAERADVTMRRENAPMGSVEKCISYCLLWCFTTYQKCSVSASATII